MAFALAASSCRRFASLMVGLSGILLTCANIILAVRQTCRDRKSLCISKMGGTATRARTKKAQPVADATAEDDDAATAVATQLAELSTRVHQLSISLALSEQKRDAMESEQRKQRDDIGMLVQKASAMEERAFHSAATIKELISEIKDVQGNVSHVEEKLADTRSRLRDVEDDHRKIEESLRSEARKSIEQIKNHVVKQQDNDVAKVIGRTVVNRAESMVSELDDVRSEVSSTVAPSSVAPRYSHSTIQTARKALRRTTPPS